MLPAHLIRFSARDGAVVPAFLGEADHPWLRALIDEHDRFAGRPERELAARMREPLPCPSPPGKRAIATRVLASVYGRLAGDGPPPRSVRAALFTAAVRHVEREAAIAEAATALSATAAQVEASLFGDLLGERVLTVRKEPISPLELALRSNLALAQGFLHRASRVNIELCGNARAIVRHAHLRGLLCTVLPRKEREFRAAIEISGPVAILRRTLLYGRALAELVPLLSWCDRFRLRADVFLRGEPLALTLATGDPIFPSNEPRRFDSQLEARFARAFARAAPGWDIVREPEPIESAGSLIFPDFLLRERSRPERSVLLEIVGFWTPGYLERKLASLRAARLPPLILCVDADRNVGEDTLPDGAEIVWFEKRIDPASVLARLEALTGRAGP